MLSLQGISYVPNICSFDEALKQQRAYLPFYIMSVNQEKL
jgi:hypothetical protein